MMARPVKSPRGGGRRTRCPKPRHSMAFNPFTTFRKYQKIWMATILLLCMLTFVLCTGAAGRPERILLRLFRPGGTVVCHDRRPQDLLARSSTISRIAATSPTSYMRKAAKDDHRRAGRGPQAGEHQEARADNPKEMRSRSRRVQKQQLQAWRSVRGSRGSSARAASRSTTSSTSSLARRGRSPGHRAHRRSGAPDHATRAGLGNRSLGRLASTAPPWTCATPQPRQRSDAHAGPAG